MKLQHTERHFMLKVDVAIREPRTQVDMASFALDWLQQTGEPGHYLFCVRDGDTLKILGEWDVEKPKLAVTRRDP